MVSDITAKDHYDGAGLDYEAVFGKNEAQIKFIKNTLMFLDAGPTTRVLDAGQGTGKPTCSMVADSGCKIYGIDISPVMVDIAKKQVPEGIFETADLLTYQPSEPFDAVYNIFSMLHFSSQELAVLGQQMGKWVRLGGYLFIGTMAAEGFAPGVFQADSPGVEGHVTQKFMGKPVRFQILTHVGWERLLMKAGFHIVSTETRPFLAEECDEQPHYYIIARKESDGS